MKKQSSPFLQFELSPDAQAGIWVNRLDPVSTTTAHGVTQAHQDDHYLFVLVTRGQYLVTLDFEDLSLAAPAFLLVFPGQVHYLREAYQAQGWAIEFDASLVDPSFSFLLEQFLPRPLVLDEGSDFYHRSLTLIQLMNDLQSDATLESSNRSVHYLLAALLSLLTSQVSTISHTDKPPENRGSQIEQAFRVLLQRHFKTWKQPAQYAAELAITVAHLNDTVKGLTGYSVSSHIQQRSMLEAKRLLYTTSLSVKEISYQVGYEEPVYFGKLFRKTTGLTPLAFRKQFRD
ncbi:hypothetical protein BWI93_08115 [Siphonobacter sp. BAB-5385]|uniref:AraC family transcriptional regulator n=2 Tax=unclassified Siphonobacter TaxID=2635712 RepID=UPI000B9E65C2|nr:helix-turn-helix transcriptional regulator [Siphonobacter sp. BAB-5385]OZI08676.1 hypothetical protein BWI93_08115 [Siphonobacter sp. BAB-5385]